MSFQTVQPNFELTDYLQNFIFTEDSKSIDANNKTKTECLSINGQNIPRFINQFWTSKQRQSNAIHQISYRACFKPNLPNFFIRLLSKEQDVIYDPFNGRGTTVIEAALLNRYIIANDINPLSTILSKPRLFIPDLKELENRLNQIKINEHLKADIDLSMFYHPKTEAEILSIRTYLIEKSFANQEDHLDKWIRMIATNRLTGHSKNFFSVYTLPPNQAISPEQQKKINALKNQQPTYKDVKKIILKKSRDLLKNITPALKEQLLHIGLNSLFLNNDARYTPEIPDNYVQLTVTSPPFLDVVPYDQDNWLRCWFNNIDVNKIREKITMSRNTDEWCSVMKQVFQELFRITRKGGYVAFEVGEVKSGKIKLDELVVPLGTRVGFICEGILVHTQTFTKTAHIWGIKNNHKGTNTNRIVVFRKK